ncbi:gamma-glutamyltransferase [Plastoroseomonas arctica]|uniref:Glutathione hydrolase proenzyme n=1 Tax=Plastoroseomonas arctica TaxID=1509237 RepID=A0AAF1JTT1_9PROT|nr:gamma-glutamyltransferase [Plastoroseomonas arctica]MBR0653470.1 gamma-glutamyltransferase [Plastoroseomonas arctica]
MRRLIFGFLLLALPASAQPLAQRHMVAAAHPLAAEAGLAMLRDGGTAIDAAVAVQMVLTLVEPQSSGIGGGALILHWDTAERRIAAIDGRETAPAAATPALFLRSGDPMAFADAVVGGRAVGVPGTVAALEAAHRLHGKLPWARLFEPAIALAEAGFTVSPRLAREIARDGRRLAEDPTARAYFFDARGQPVAAGTRLRNPALAATLRAIAAHGAAALHRGPIAADIADAVRGHPTNPGLMTMDDLAAYQPRLREPVCSEYRRRRVCGFPPPSSGGVAIGQILGVLEHFDMSHFAPNSLDAAHLIAEAGRLAFADRAAYLGDPDQVRVPVRGLLDRAYLTARAQLVDRLRAMPALPRAGNPPWREAAYAAQEEQPEHGTSHIAIVDEAGNAVSMTTTIEAVFGSQVMVRGFMLNNELTDFAFRPEVEGRPVANAVGAGKRPRSSMSPTLVFDEEGRLAFIVGSPGGARIIGFVARTLVGLLDWNLSPQAAIDLPHVLTLGATVELEAETPMAALGPALEAMGHRVVIGTLGSGLQAIRIRRDGSAVAIDGGADRRREGAALGE